MRERIFTIVAALLLASAVAYTQSGPPAGSNPTHVDATVRNLHITSVPFNNCLETAPGSNLVIGSGLPCGTSSGGGVTSVGQGYGIVITGSGSQPIVNLATPIAAIPTPTGTNGIVVNGQVISLQTPIAPSSLPTTSVVPGSYTNTNVTFDAFGRATSASNGTGGTGVPPGTSAQIVGYNIANTAISATVSGDCAFNATYGITCTRINGIAPGNVCPANQWVNQISGSAVGTCARPNFSDIAGTIAAGQLPTLGTAGTCTNCTMNVDQFGRVATYGSGSQSSINGVAMEPTTVPSPTIGSYYVFKVTAAGRFLAVPYILFVTVNNLPSCTASNTGTIAGVTNCVSCQFGQTCADAGAGGVFCPETCMVGGNWQAQ